jgi:predicted nucleic acid-binding protein
VLSTVRIIPLISRIARIAGDLRRLYPRLKTADGAIAATALFTNCTLVTRNARDFKRIEGLRFLKI